MAITSRFYGNKCAHSENIVSIFFQSNGRGKQVPGSFVPERAQRSIFFIAQIILFTSEKIEKNLSEGKKR